jgi:hypothetical protein
MNVLVAMNVVALAGTCIVDSLNFNYFCSSFVVHEPFDFLKLEPLLVISGSKLSNSL